MEVNVYDLLDIYENEVSRNTKNNRKINNFERNKMQNISIPKYRIVMSLNIKDKIINHYVTIHILLNKLDKYLDIRNCATRKNMGYDYAIKLLVRYLEDNKKYGKFYILRIDISKYFYSIDHNVLKGLLIDNLGDDEYKIVCDIIDSTNTGYINEEINRIKNRLYEVEGKRSNEIDKIPLIDYGKSLPIGNMTSQFLSIFYLYKLDHYIVNDLKLKYMVRYMDDYVIMSRDKDYLKYALGAIRNKLENDYKLNVNDKKTFIADSYNGFEFLGYRFRVINNKIIINIKSENKRRRNKNIKKVNYLYSNGLISYKGYFNSMSNYMNGYKYEKN